MKKQQNNRAAARRPASEPSAAAPVGVPAETPRSTAWRWYALAGLVLLLAVFEAYGPALPGEFLFDDSYLPFADPGIGDANLHAWMGTRPLLMLSFWINFRFFDNEPFWLHVFNVLLHLLNGALVFLITRRLLAKTGEEGAKHDLLAAFGAGLFLLHPLQTEAVAYIASRSEALSVLFFYAALAVFLHRREEAISLRESAAVLALFGAAVLTKEHTAVLPALLVLTDLFFSAGRSPSSLLRNGRLYLPMAVLGAVGAAFVWRVLSAADTAGFNVKAFTWYEYFFTQCRVVWLYFRMLVLPYGQNVDTDFMLSRTPLEHGALFGMAALAAVLVAAWLFRRRYPLASFGVFVWFLLLAPTSSFIPIADVVAERRIYLPFLGFLLIVLEFLRRVRLSRGTLSAILAGVLVVLTVLTWQRAHVWSNAIALWGDSTAKSPAKVRPRFQLAYAYYQAGRCREAVREYSHTASLKPPDYRLLVDWALAYDCDNRPEEALTRLRQAIALERNSHAYALVGMVEGKRGNRDAALEALSTALSLDPQNDGALAYRGNLAATAGNLQQAAVDYRQALAINPRNLVALQGIQSIEAALRGKDR